MSSNKSNTTANSTSSPNPGSSRGAGFAMKSLSIAALIACALPSASAAMLPMMGGMGGMGMDPMHMGMGGMPPIGGMPMMGMNPMGMNPMMGMGMPPMGGMGMHMPMGMGMPMGGMIPPMMPGMMGGMGGMGGMPMGMGMSPNGYHYKRGRSRGPFGLFGRTRGHWRPNSPFGSPYSMGPGMPGMGPMGMPPGAPMLQMPPGF